MKKQSLLAAVIAGTSLLFASCMKNDSTEPQNNPIRNTRAFTEKLGPQKQTFTINASELPRTITLAGGTKITFPVGSLAKNGTPVTGQVSIEAFELFKRADFVSFGANTNHISGAPLKSDGSIFVDVKSNGQSVDAQLQVPIHVEVPTSRDGFTQIWAGTDTVQGNQFAWQAPRQAAGQAQEVKVNAQKFIFDFGNLGWINCDVFWAMVNPKTTIHITVLNNPGTMASFRAFAGETFVFFVAKGKNDNVAAQLYTPDGPGKVKSYDNMMPVGATGRLFSFCIKEGKFYFAKKDITITANQSETLTLEETTQAALQAEITALDTF